MVADRESVACAGGCGAFRADVCRSGEAPHAGRLGKVDCLKGDPVRGSCQHEPEVANGDRRDLLLVEGVPCGKLGVFEEL